MCVIAAEPLSADAGGEARFCRVPDTFEPWERVRAFYRSRVVRDRILEYCGAEDSRLPTAWGMAGYGGARGLSGADGSPVSCPSVDPLRCLLEQGADVTRCLGDDRASLVLLDIDYVNHEDPSEAYRDPALCFETLEPVYRAAEAWFHSCGLRPLVIMTRQGYHLAGRVILDSQAHDLLVSLGRIGEPMKGKYLRYGLERTDAPKMGRAHEAIGRLLEYTGHRVIERLQKDGFEVPVKLADLPPEGGGRFVCLDLSAHADPLYLRFVRTAYSSHQKAIVAGLPVPVPFTFTLPRRGRTVATLLRARENPEEAMDLAQEDRADVPIFGSAPLLRWIEDYRRSRLALFHELFDDGWHDEPQEWDRTYDRLDPASLVPEAGWALSNPNPQLLKPSGLRSVVLDLRRKGWHPRSIAGLIRSKFERDYGWGDYWYRYDAASRADFYVRVICGEDLVLPGGGTEA
jgi:hypothetical protein